MQVASRPRFTAGVALVGAGLVVASTVSPVPDVHLPDVHLPALRSAEVALAAAADPLPIYSQVLHDALANVGALSQNFQPAQVLQAILGNQLNNLATVGSGLGAALTTQVPQLVETAVSQLVAGNVVGAANSLLQIPLAVGLPALPALLNPLQSVANVINAFTADPLATELLLSCFIAPLISTPAAAATAIQNVIGAVGTGNPLAVVGAILGAPGTVVDGLLNGGYGPDLAPLTGLAGVIVKAGGLLSSSSLEIDSSGNVVVGTGGPIAALEQVLKQIAGALAPTATTAVKVAQPEVASLQSTAATTVTLSTGSSAVEPAKDLKSTETPAQKPESTSTTEDSAGGSTDSESVSGTTESTSKPESTPKPESMPKPESTDTKPSDKGADVKTGDKAEPSTGSASEAAKPGAHETTATDKTATEKSAEKSSSTARHAKSTK